MRYISDCVLGNTLLSGNPSHPQYPPLGIELEHRLDQSTLTTIGLDSVGLDSVNLTSHISASSSA